MGLYAFGGRRFGANWTGAYKSNRGGQHHGDELAKLANVQGSVTYSVFFCGPSAVT